MRRARHGGAERGERFVRRFAGVLSVTAVLGLIATLALAPLSRPDSASPAFAASADSPHSGDTQQVEVASDVAAPAVSHESYTAATGPQTLVAGGTNHDWAKLVLVFGGFPVTDENVAVITQWMREENGPDNWWNRNNPLNNGNGSGGGSGLGSYATLQVGAEYAADSLRRLSFYDAIEAGLDAGTSAATTAAAIWASPWATSHYGNGAHWTTSPVPVVEAPASAW
ncbi:hypothetical protein LQ757_02075 [Agromyces sp. SYSU K20354]|uniref:hypothetical protein n=1 Tax=Agromyces cavernae TaxID=2898659 RepID=UPI001E38C33F|nr:hypothetical protein [Agromyces cavernae]MCD2441053.1 hypothetical protein [Agromyces cavernae]